MVSILFVLDLAAVSLIVESDALAIAVENQACTGGTKVNGGRSCTYERDLRKGRSACMCNMPFGLPINSSKGK